MRKKTHNFGMALKSTEELITVESWNLHIIWKAKWLAIYVGYNEVSWSCNLITPKNISTSNS